MGKKWRKFCSVEVNMDIQLFNADCVTVLEQLSPNSIDLMLTDPPYNLGNFMKDRDTNLQKMRDNFFGSAGWDDLDEDSWKKSMDSFFVAADKVIKKNGALIIFMAIIKVPIIIELAQKHGFYYKTTGIWHKTNPMPRNMNLHFVNSTEAWIYFVHNGRTGTFNNDGKVIHDFFESAVASSAERAHGKHPTQKPQKLLENFIVLLSNPEEVVCDPFMGSGSTGVAAKKLGRSFIGIEIQNDYYQIAQKRMSEVQK